MRAVNWAYVHWVLPALASERNRGLSQRLDRYQRLEQLSLTETEALQFDALTALVKHAYETTPFYRRRFDEAGVAIDRFKSRADLQRLPFLTRDDMRENLDDLWSRRFRREQLRESATGGTTDTPVRFYRDVAALREKNAVQLNFDRWAGVLPGDKVFHLWGANVDFAEHPSWRWRLYDRHVLRRVWAPAARLNDETLERYRCALNEQRPAVINAYPTALAIFCRFLRDSGRTYHKPRAVIVTAETLLTDERRTIERVLDCPVFERYGSREFGMIASECERHDGLHLNPLSAYVEYVPVAGGEDDGLHEVIVTDLLNYGMPLIRYRVNDCATIGPVSCPCGRGYPLLQHVIGRVTEVFRLPDGSKVPGVSLTSRILRVCPGLRKTQIVQETLTQFRLRYVTGPAFSPRDLELVRTNMRALLGPEVDVTFEKVDEIERERSGKTRFCISQLPVTR